MSILTSGQINRESRVRKVLLHRSEPWNPDTPITITGVEFYWEPDVYVIHVSIEDTSPDEPWRCAIHAKDEFDAARMAVEQVKSVFGANNVRWLGEPTDKTHDSAIA